MILQSLYSRGFKRHAIACFFYAEMYSSQKSSSELYIILIRGTYLTSKHVVLYSDADELSW